MNWGRTAKGLLIFSITILFYLLVVVSMLPLVAWWAGMVAVFLILLYYLLKNFVPSLKQTLMKKFIRRWLKLSMIAVFFGIFVHFSCRAYSNYRVENLREECKQEKQAVFQQIQQQSQTK